LRERDLDARVRQRPGDGGVDLMRQGQAFVDALGEHAHFEIERAIAKADENTLGGGSSSTNGTRRSAAVITSRARVVSVP
jgi:hypothetical protein